MPDRKTTSSNLTIVRFSASTSVSSFSPVTSNLNVRSSLLLEVVTWNRNGYW